MARDEGWHFVQLGLFLERAAGTARLLACQIREAPPSTGTDDALDEQLEWIACCGRVMRSSCIGGAAARSCSRTASCASSSPIRSRHAVCATRSTKLHAPSRPRRGSARSAPVVVSSALTSASTRLGRSSDRSARRGVGHRGRMRSHSPHGVRDLHRSPAIRQSRWRRGSTRGLHRHARTRFQYQGPVHESVMEVRLGPAHDSRQEVQRST